VLVLAAAITGPASGNVVNNGSFELNSAGTSRYNLSNPAFTGYMQSAHAFGVSEELEITFGVDYGIAAQDGSWKVGMHERARPGTGSDAFSLSLSSAVTAGTH